MKVWAEGASHVCRGDNINTVGRCVYACNAVATCRDPVCKEDEEEGKIKSDDKAEEKRYKCYHGTNLG